MWSFAAAALVARPALADGAFPDELSVYLPPDDSSDILLGTNFGLAMSHDAGQSWRYVCELYITRDANDIVNYYKIASQKIGQESAPAIIAISLIRFMRSADGGCTWQPAGGALTGLYPRDAFIDPNDSSFVLALASDLTKDGIYPSHDGGATFSAPAYTTLNTMASVEIARSDGSIVYATELAFTGPDAGKAYLLKSTDRGATWPTRQPLSVPSGAVVRIAAVDPQDATKIYLRVFTPSTAADEIRITTDAGTTLTSTVQVSDPTLFSAFLIANDGTRYAATTQADLYAAPANQSFSKRIGPRARCLGERQGSSRIYACGVQFADGYNLGYSDDGAMTFQHLMNFTDIAGPLECQPQNSFCAPQFEILKGTLGADAGTGPGRVTGTGGSHCGSVGASGLVSLLVVLTYSVFARRARK
jgi:photosystem II stability/assembly factor-like uncharacterized protein